MFCKKCGSQISDDAAFCSKCGCRFEATFDDTAGSSPPQVIYIDRPAPYSMISRSLKSELVLTPTEKAFMLIVGIVALLNGAISLFSGSSNDEYAEIPGSSYSNYITVISNALSIVMIILGIFTFLKHRWSFITLEVCFIISALFQLIGTLMTLGSASGPDIFTNVIILAYLTAMVVFTHLSQKALSSSAQSLRRSFAEKRQKRSRQSSLLSSENDSAASEIWICSSCGERNPKNSAICRGCGKYK